MAVPTGNRALCRLIGTSGRLIYGLESANGDIVVTPCNWNKKCFIICNDESGLVAAVTDGICMDHGDVVTFLKVKDTKFADRS